MKIYDSLDAIRYDPEKGGDEQQFEVYAFPDGSVKVFQAETAIRYGFPNKHAKVYPREWRASYLCINPDGEKGWASVVFTAGGPYNAAGRALDTLNRKLPDGCQYDIVKIEVVEVPE